MANISTDEDYPFLYTDDPTTTGISIGTTLNKADRLYGKKPLLLVSRGGVNSQPISMGDTAQASFDGITKKGTTFVQSSVDIKTIARTSGEVDTISNEVYSFLVACRTILPALSAIHQIRSISLTPVAPYEEDDHMFYTHAVVDYVMQYKWNWSITPILLREIGLHINDDLIMDLS